MNSHDVHTDAQHPGTVEKTFSVIREVGQERRMNGRRQGGQEGVKKEDYLRRRGRGSRRLPKEVDLKAGFFRVNGSLLLGEEVGNGMMFRVHTCKLSHSTKAYITPFSTLLW